MSSDILSGMIIGSHFLLYSKNAEADRNFFRDVLGFRYVDAGHGWLIFAMSPAEAGIHPLEGKELEGREKEESQQQRAGHELLGGVLYLMSDDLKESIATLKTRSVQCSAVETAPWGMTTTIPLPGGGSIGLYQPRHKTALDLK